MPRSCIPIATLWVEHWRREDIEYLEDVAERAAGFRG